MWQLVLGALVAALITIVVEYLRRPQLKLSVEQPIDQPQPRFGAQHWRAVRVNVRNESLPCFAKWMLRAPALQCRATITLHHLHDGHMVFNRTMDARWPGSPEPVPITGVFPDGSSFQLLDFARLFAPSRFDIYAGEQTSIDVAVKFDDERECYGWNNDAYFADPPGKSPQWKLDYGQYLLVVTVYSSGQETTDVFRLVNDVARSDFRLELASPEEKRRIQT